MARPKKTDRPVEKTISLRTSLTARVDLELYSELEGKVPFGAWSRLVEGLLQQWLAQRATIKEIAKGVEGEL